MRNAPPEDSVRGLDLADSGDDHGIQGHPFLRLASVPAMVHATLIASIVVSFVAGGCGSVAQVGAPPVTLRIAGSSAMRPVLLELTAAYERTHSNVAFEVIGGGTELGIRAVEEGKADIAAVSWAPDPTAAPPGYRMTPIARDGLTIITHPRNPAQGLTLLQLRALYRGEVLDWAALGGPAGEPAIISREEGSGDRQAFETLVMGGERVSLSALVLSTAEAVAEYVAEHPAAIGYVSTAQQSDAVRVLSVEGLLPSAESVRSGAYHLSRLLYLLTPASASPQARSFVDFVLSPAGQSIVSRHHVALR
jgi:phosphate transport system substrate-binding protein